MGCTVVNHALAGLVIGVGLLCMNQHPAVASPNVTYQVAQYNANTDSDEAYEQRIAPALREGYREMYGEPEDSAAERFKKSQEQAHVAGVAIIVGLGLLGAIFKGRG